jgi:plastocyanin
MSRYVRHIGAFALVASLVVSTGGQALAAKPRPEASGLRVTKTIAMKDNLFKPKTVTVARGTTIKWVNRGESAHTTTSRKTGLWDRTLSSGQSYSRKFKRAGTFKYFCKFHDGMVGKIVVT